MENPRSRQPSHPTFSYQHIQIFTKDLALCRDIANRASPVNRDHIKRPSLLKQSYAIGLQRLAEKGTFLYWPIPIGKYISIKVMHSTDYNTHAKLVATLHDVPLSTGQTTAQALTGPRLRYCPIANSR